MIDWNDYAKELLVLAVDSVVLVAAFRWFRNNSKAVNALEDPVLVEHRALTNWLEKEAPGKWAVLQGPVEPIGPIIHSFNDKSVKGVVQRLKVKEFVTARSTAGFWQDGQRTIADTLNVVPFGVRIGRSLVEIEDPREVACHSLRTVASEYKQKSLNVLEQIWGFLVGTRHRGIQSTEEMLLVGTKLTAIGSLAKDKSMGSTEGVSMNPYLLSELTVTELRKRLRVRSRWALFWLVTAGFTGAAIITIILRRALETQRLEEIEEDRRKKRLEAKRKAEPDADNSDAATCIICDNPREVILLPCGHICLCFDCSKEINNVCPICRATVEKVSEYYIA